MSFCLLHCFTRFFNFHHAFFATSWEFELQIGRQDHNVRKPIPVSLTWTQILLPHSAGMIEVFARTQQRLRWKSRQRRVTQYILRSPKGRDLCRLSADPAVLHLSCLVCIDWISSRIFLPVAKAKRLFLFSANIDTWLTKLFACNVSLSCRHVRARSISCTAFRCWLNSWQLTVRTKLLLGWFLSWRGGWWEPC